MDARLPQRGVRLGKAGDCGRARGRGYAAEQLTEDGTTPVPLPVKPKLVVAPAARFPFQERFFTLTIEPLWLTVPLHNWEMVWPFGNAQVTVQPEMAVVPELFTVTSAWKPPCQELVSLYVAAHALYRLGLGDGDGDNGGSQSPVFDGGQVGVGLGDGDGDGDGETDGLGEGEGLPDGLADGLGDGDCSVPGALPQILLEPE